MVFRIFFSLALVYLLVASSVLAQNNPVSSLTKNESQENKIEDTKKETPKESDSVQNYLLNPKNPFLSSLPKPEPVIIPDPLPQPSKVDNTQKVMPPPPPKKIEIITQKALNLEINGVVWGGEIPQAIVNGKIVKVGDNVDQMKIESITRQGIGVLYLGDQFKDQRIVLKMD